MIFDKFLSLLPSELDGALIMSEENRRYFTSFPSSDGVLLISRNGTVFLTDSRYVEAAQKKITVCPVRLTKDLSTELPQLMSEFKINNLAVETTRLTVAQFEEFTKWMPDTGICTENYADRAIDALRMVKSDDEVKLVCEAQVIAERAFDHILEFIKPGVTEREFSSNSTTICSETARRRSRLRRSQSAESTHRCRTACPRTKRLKTATSSPWTTVRSSADTTAT